MSAAALPIGATGSPLGVLAATERIQQLRALIAQVEHHPAGATTFASALGAAQSGATGSPATASIEEGPYTASSTTPLNTAELAAPTESGSGANGGAAGAYAPLIEQTAARYGLDPAVLYGLIQQESGFDPSARSAAGALGLTQLMPSTAASLGVAEPLDPAQSIEGGARYLSQLMHQFAGNTADALAAYNAGPGAVQQYGGVPPYPETQQYVTKVLGYAAAYQQSIGSQPPGIPANSPALSTSASTMPATGTVAGATTGIGASILTSGASA
jgi:soluble lytic murein transglycosylase-like protein